MSLSDKDKQLLKELRATMHIKPSAFSIKNGNLVVTRTVKKKVGEQKQRQPQTQTQIDKKVLRNFTYHKLGLQNHVRHWDRIQCNGILKKS